MRETTHTPLHFQTPPGQRGAALITSLIILVAVTIITLTSLGNTLLELRMSTNEESSMQAFQSAQAAIDEVIKNEKTNVIVTGNIGHTNCSTYYPNACEMNGVTLSNPPFKNLSGAMINTIQITRTSNEICPPRMSRGSSCTKVQGVNFDIESTYDNTLSGLGKAVLTQGFVRLVPASAQSQSGQGPPPGATPTSNAG